MKSNSRLFNSLQYIDSIYVLYIEFVSLCNSHCCTNGEQIPGNDKFSDICSTNKTLLRNSFKTLGKHVNGLKWSVKRKFCLRCSVLSAFQHPWENMERCEFFALSLCFLHICGKKPHMLLNENLPCHVAALHAGLLRLLWGDKRMLLWVFSTLRG